MQQQGNDAMTDINDYDDALDEVETQESRLPSLIDGIPAQEKASVEYILNLFGLAHVDGESGVYDIFQFEILDSKGEGAGAPGTKAKWSVRRDERGQKGEMANEKLAKALVAMNGGKVPGSNKAYLQGLRANPSGKLRMRIVKSKALKTGNLYNKFEFYPA
jgi:hypothetical protein